MRTRNEMMPLADAGPVERPVRPHVADARKTMQATDEMVNRFLTWPVPADVYPDGTPGQPGRTGTNLLTAAQARYMLDHVLAGELTTLPPGFEDEAYKAAHEESNRDWKDFVRGAKWAFKRLLKA